MGRRLNTIKVGTLVTSIVGRILNKFDFVTVIEGGTGQSKSTLAIHIALGVRREFSKLYRLQKDRVEYYYENVMKRQGMTMESFMEMLLDWKEKKYYKYNPYADLIYDHKSMLKGLTSWHKVLIPDEAILLSHNRDFQGPEQKKIIKMINIYRDHGNVVLMCIPNFNALDIQLKSMVKMRISVARRGIGIVQTPNKNFYGRDKWETALNEKIEKEYLYKNPNKPAFAKLTTARAIVAYKKLSDKLELQYQTIKNEKRGSFEEESGVTKEIENPNSLDKRDHIEHFAKLLMANGIKNRAALAGYAAAIGLTENLLHDRATAYLRKHNKPTEFGFYYWDKKERKQQIAPLIA